MTRTSEVSDDMLMALADGELPEAQAHDLRARFGADPVLAARFAIFAETRALMQTAFPAEPVPKHLIAAVMQGAGSTGAGDIAAGDRMETVVPFARRKRLAAPGWGMALLAASLVLTVGAAGFLAGRSVAPLPIATATGPEAAAVELAAVPTGGAVMLDDGTEARALASYQTDLGLCRLIGTDTTRAVACRAETGWAVALTVTATGGEAYLPASDLGTALIDQFLDDIAASAALDTDAEARALRP